MLLYHSQVCTQTNPSQPAKIPYIYPFPLFQPLYYELSFGIYRAQDANLLNLLALINTYTHHIISHDDIAHCAF
jgi:hypothetical protein